MAHKLSDFTRPVAAGGAYPYGDIKDNPNGTLVNRLMMTDSIQFWQKLMADAGITPNSQDDNSANGYQLMSALLNRIANGAPGDAGGVWIDAASGGATPTLTPSNSPAGTITVTSGDVAYNRYKRLGKTLHWQMKLNTITFAGTAFSSIIVNPPIAWNFPNQQMKMIGFYNGAPTMIVSLEGPTLPGQITLSLSGGGNFTIGANNQSLDICVIAELA